MLYLGAIGDRYGRKLLLVLGMALSVPACLLAAYAPSTAVLVAARLVGGLSAGTAYPTTLALVTALWAGPARTRAIALWSGIGSALAALGPLVSGLLLEYFWWGSVFVFTVPFAVIALVMAIVYVPAHVNESTSAVDNLGGILSPVLVTALILAINLAPVPGKGVATVALTAVAAAAAAAFVLRQRRAANPMYDLHIAGRRVFWVAAVGGLIVFGSLMASSWCSSCSPARTTSSGCSANTTKQTPRRARRARQQRPRPNKGAAEAGALRAQLSRRRDAGRPWAWGQRPLGIWPHQRGARRSSVEG